jgi:hypothetical protein
MELNNYQLGIEGFKQIIIPENIQRRYNFFIESSGDLTLVPKTSPKPENCIQVQKCTCFNREANDGICNGGCT